MPQLKDDIVIFAGATGRVGGETLRLLVESGARVAVVSRAKDRAEAVIRQYGAPER